MAELIGILLTETGRTGSSCFCWISEPRNLRERYSLYFLCKYLNISCCSSYCIAQGFNSNPAPPTPWIPSYLLLGSVPRPAFHLFIPSQCGLLRFSYSPLGLLSGSLSKGSNQAFEVFLYPDSHLALRLFTSKINRASFLPLLQIPAQCSEQFHTPPAH